MIKLVAFDWNGTFLVRFKGIMTFQLKKAKPDFLISNLKEVISIVRNLAG